MGPQTSLSREAVLREPIRPAGACMTQHDLAQAPTRAQRKPRLGGARGRSQAQPGLRPLIWPLPPLSFSVSLFLGLHLLDAPKARPGWAYPARKSPLVREPAASGRAREHNTLTQLRRPWRAPLLAGGCSGPRG